MAVLLFFVSFNLCPREEKWIPKSYTSFSSTESLSAISKLALTVFVFETKPIKFSFVNGCWSLKS